MDSGGKREVDKSLELVSSNIQDVQKTLSETRAEAAEQRDKESRRNDVVIYKVPESKEARADDRNKEDISFCLQLFNSVLQAGQRVLWRRILCMFSCWDIEERMERQDC